MSQQTAKAFRFSEEELALLTSMTKKYGSQKAAIMAGLRALEQCNQPTNKELLALLKERLG